MNAETKIILVRFGAFLVLCGLFWVCWWMDYCWKRGPRGVGFSKANGQSRWDCYNPKFQGPPVKEKTPIVTYAVNAIVIGIVICLCFIKV